MRKVFYWLPRGAAILLIIFISLFSLDVFGKPNWFLALLMHLLPSFILIVATVIAWKKELLGGIIFVILGLLFLLFTHFEAWILAIPAVIIGLLFCVNRSSIFRFPS